LTTTAAFITPLHLSDLEAVALLEAENPAAWSARQWQDELAQPNGWQWAARSGPAGALVGYLCGRSVLDEAEIFKLAVASASRRQGIASLLITRACRELKRTGIKTCYLELHVSNRIAELLYAKMGFFPLGVRTGYYGPGEDGLLMRKEL
jgi:[ribosomal protein S18]-alanine N-acetyltransferase